MYVIVLTDTTIILQLGSHHDMAILKTTGVGCWFLVWGLSRFRRWMLEVWVGIIYLLAPWHRPIVIDSEAIIDLSHWAEPASDKIDPTAAGVWIVGDGLHGDFCDISSRSRAYQCPELIPNQPADDWMVVGGLCPFFDSVAPRWHSELGWLFLLGVEPV